MTHRSKALLTEELIAIKEYNCLTTEKIAQITQRKMVETIDGWLLGDPVIPIKALRLVRKWHKKKGGVSLANPVFDALPPLESTKILSDISAISTRQMAEAHVDWLLKTIRPLLISQFVHGYRHGRNDRTLEP